MTNRPIPKALAAKLEQHAAKVLTSILGAPADDHGTQTWQFPYGDTGGTVSIRLICESHETGPFTSRTPWLACRLSNPAHVGADGYTLPKAAMPTRWPEVFTYPSGKCNLHSFRGITLAEWERMLALHLYSIAAPKSPEKQAFGSITWETV